MSKQITRRPTKQARRQDRRDEMARREAERLRAARTRRTTLISIAVAVVLIASVITYFVFFNGRNTQTQTQAVQCSNSNSAYPQVDNVCCDQLEQTTVHYHAHLSMYINGQSVALPQGVGIASDNSCYYWLHTHDTKGIIHIESPGDQTFTLGTFFKEWGDRFPQLSYPAQLDLSGWQTYVDGKPYTGDFHKITLASHELITLAYNSPGIKPDTVYDWNAAGLQQ